MHINPKLNRLGFGRHQLNAIDFHVQVLGL
jgi:hypothetical protein